MCIRDRSITASGQTFSDQQTGAIQFYDGTNSSISLTNVNFTGNTSFYGGAVYSYAENFVQNGGAYHGNKAVDNESGPNAEGKVEDGAFGGALMLKGNYNVILTDVDFAKNSASAANGMAYGLSLIHIFGLTHERPFRTESRGRRLRRASGLSFDETCP